MPHGCVSKADRELKETIYMTVKETKNGQRKQFGGCQGPARGWEAQLPWGEREFFGVMKIVCNFTMVVDT